MAKHHVSHETVLAPGEAYNSPSGTLVNGLRAALVSHENANVAVRTADGRE